MTSSFAYTTKEQLRVLLGSVFGHKVDHIGYGDLAVVCTWAAMHTIQLAMLLYMVVHRKYPAIRGARPGNLAFICGASAFWFVGDIVVNGLVHPDTKVLQNCIVMSVWVRSALGETGLYMVLNFRALRLYFEYRLNRRFSLSIALCFAGLLFGINLIAPVAVTVLPTSKTANFVEGLEVCNIHDGFKTVLIALCWGALATTLMAAALVFLLVECKHNEHKQLLAACAPLTVAVVVQTIMFYKKPTYPLSFPLRATMVSIDQFAALACWWALAGPSIYNCMFRHQIHILEWKQAHPTLPPRSE